MDRIEANPTAPVEYWLRTLVNVRFYPDGRERASKVVPVQENRVGDENDRCSATLEDLRAGTWVGERTLRLRNGAVVVFCESRAGS